MKDVYVVAHNVMLIWGNQSTVSKQVIRMLDKLQEDVRLKICIYCSDKSLSFIRLPYWTRVLIVSLILNRTKKIGFVYPAEKNIN